MAFRTTSFACPACHEALAADAAIAWCKGCNGVWVSEAELEERVRIVRGKSELDLKLVFVPDHSSSHAQTRRPCPLCQVDTTFDVIELITWVIVGLFD